MHPTPWSVPSCSRAALPWSDATRPGRLVGLRLDMALSSQSWMTRPTAAARWVHPRGIGAVTRIPLRFGSRFASRHTRPMVDSLTRNPMGQPRAAQMRHRGRWQREGLRDDPLPHLQLVHSRPPGAVCTPARLRHALEPRAPDSTICGDTSTCFARRVVARPRRPAARSRRVTARCSRVLARTVARHETAIRPQETDSASQPESVPPFSTSFILVELRGFEPLTF
jgi:hypothetical protein